MSDPPDPPAPEAPRRPLGRWILLLIIWTLGLVVWVLYFLLVAWLVLKIF